MRLPQGRASLQRDGLDGGGVGGSDVTVEDLLRIVITLPHNERVVDAVEQVG